MKILRMILIVISCTTLISCAESTAGDNEYIQLGCWYFDHTVETSAIIYADDRIAKVKSVTLPTDVNSVAEIHVEGGYDIANTILKNQLSAAPLDWEYSGDASVSGGNFIRYTIDGKLNEIGFFHEVNETDVNPLNEWIISTRDEMLEAIPSIADHVIGTCG